jgi:DNA-binding XRE family transcriptional regulator
MGRTRAGQPRSVRKTVAGKFGQRLEQLAAESGLTTAEFARKAGVTEDAITTISTERIGTHFLQGDSNPAGYLNSQPRNGIAPIMTPAGFEPALQE